MFIVDCHELRIDVKEKLHAEINHSVDKGFIETPFSQLLLFLLQQALATMATDDMDQSGPDRKELGLRADGSVVADDDDFCFQFVRR